MALAIGCVGALLSIVRTTFFQPLPVHDPDSLLSIYTTLQGDSRLLPVSYPNYRDLSERSRSFDALTAFQAIEVSVGANSPEVVWGQMVTQGFFPVLGVPMTLGRGFTSEEDQDLGAHPVVVLGHNLWERKYGGDPGLLGSSIHINDRPYEVVGIAEEGFTGTGKLLEFQLWIPFGMREAVFAWSQHIDKRDWQLFRVVGRLRSHVTAEQAEAEGRAIFSGLVAEHPKENDRQSLSMVSMAHSGLGVNQRDRLLRVTGLLTAITALFLLLTCANVANLLLQKELAGRKNMAVRVALGASWRRLQGSLLTESTLLCLAGGILGIGIASICRSLLWHLRPPELSLMPAYPTIDLPIMLLMMAAAVLCGILVGLVPAWHLSRQDLTIYLKTDRLQGSRGKSSQGLRKVLVGVQICLAFLTLVCTSLMIGNLVSLYSTDPGIDDHVFFVTVNPRLTGYDELSGQRVMEAVRSELTHRPSIRSVGLTDSRPFKDLKTVRGLLLQDDVASPENRGRLFSVSSVSTGYLETLGVSLLEGRGIALQDRQDTPRVAVINKTLAQLYWPDRSPVGLRFRFAEEPDEFVTIVGVVADFQQGTLDEPPAGFLYVPMAQYPVGQVVIALRGTADSGLLMSEVRKAVNRVDPGLPLMQPMTTADMLREARAPHRLGTSLLAVFGLAALGLSGLGVFGLIGHFVQQRRSEIGIRMALGADRRQVLRLLLLQIVPAAGVGLVLGGLMSRGLLQWLGWLRYERTSFFAAVVVAGCVMVSLCVAATLLPGFKVSSANPAYSLRRKAG